MNIIRKGLLIFSTILIAGILPAQASTVHSLNKDLSPGFHFNPGTPPNRGSNREAEWSRNVFYGPPATIYNPGFTQKQNRGIWSLVGRTNNAYHFDPSTTRGSFGIFSRQFYVNLGIKELDGPDSKFPGINPSPVPVPAAVWMFGSAIAGFCLFVRRRKYYS